MQVLFINEFNSCEISNQVFFDVMFYFWKQKTNWLWHKYCKIKLLSDPILHDVSNEPEAYLEPSQISMREHFSKNS